MAYYTWLDIVENGTARTYQDHTATPHVNFATGVKGVTDDQLRRRITGAAAAGLHEITSAVAICALQPQLFYVFLVAQVEFDLFAQLIVGIERVGETEICNDDIPVAVQEQVLELQISVDNASSVQVPDARDQLREELARRNIFEISLIENVIEELAA